MAFSILDSALATAVAATTTASTVTAAAIRLSFAVTFQAIYGSAGICLLKRQLFDLYATGSALEVHAADVEHLAFKAHLCHPPRKL